MPTHQVPTTSSNTPEPPQTLMELQVQPGAEDTKQSPLLKDLRGSWEAVFLCDEWAQDCPPHFLVVWSTTYGPVREQSGCLGSQR